MSPVTVIGEAAPVLEPVVPPSSEVHNTVNICAAPLSAPAVKPTVIELLPPVALVIVGAPGAAAGTTEAEGADGLLLASRASVATTVHV